MKKYTWKEVPALNIPVRVKYYFDFTQKENVLYVYDKLGYVVKRINDTIFFPCGNHLIKKLMKSFEKENTMKPNDFENKEQWLAYCEYLLRKFGKIYNEETETFENGD